MALLEISSVSKRFGGVQALDGINFSVEAGEVRGLIGENGSGKSTTMRVLSGQISPDSGRVLVDGEELPNLDPTARLRAGVGVVFQEPHVCPNLTVAENLFLGRLPTSRRVVQWKELRRRSDEVLARAKISLSSSALVGALSQDDQHMSEVARVLAQDCHVIGFDETTASLTEDQVERLFAVVRSRREAGAASIFISHRLKEIFEICDSVTVLRDGKIAGTVPTATTNEDEIVRLMVGRSLENQFFRPPAPKGDKQLDVREMSARHLRTEINLEVRAGEVVGIGGLVGSGRTTLLEAIYGLIPRRGEVICRGRPVRPGNPRAAIKAGIGFVPEDRRRQGLATEQSVRANAAMLLIGEGGLLAPASRRRENALVKMLRERVALKAPDADAPVRTLSGGNQQKVVLGRWLEHRPSVLLLDEPTRGIDVGAKREIYDLIHALAEAGTSILLVSSELPELIGLSDRIIVLHEGLVAGEFEHGVTEEDLGRAMAGINGDAA